MFTRPGSLVFVIERDFQYEFVNFWVNRKTNWTVPTELSRDRIKALLRS